MTLDYALYEFMISSVNSFIEVKMNEGSFNKSHQGIVSLLYLDNITSTPVGAISNDNRMSSNIVPVYVLIGSGSALMAALVTLWRLRKKIEHAILNDEDNYSDVSGEWSSNYNSHLWDQYEESESTPKHRNYKINVLEQIDVKQTT